MSSQGKIRRRLHGQLFKLPLMITCHEFESFILAYLEDELSTRQKFVFELHLKMCQECREYLAAYRASLELPRGAIEQDQISLQNEIPEDLIKAILAARDV